ncbi:MAG: AbrB/MazE/SpoVT family DNA-binding domain-containing protein [Candidatus Woesearchaeota archaeon]|nr:AbrB/MazE/SpoVT family DNA-binding domain-containing protein [Candidatus Woesearchaeota archaeon]
MKNKKESNKVYILQTDKRGQIVIPKEIRSYFGIREGCNFSIYSISNSGIFLKLKKRQP